MPRAKKTGRGDRNKMPTTSLRPLYSLLVFVLFGTFAFAQNDVQVYSTVDRNEMNEGDTFTYSISATSSSSVTVEQPRLSDMSQFDVVNSWTGSESRSTFTNGTFQVQQSRTFNYMLAPKSKGQLTIGAAQVVVNGQSYNTKPITVNVLAGAAMNVPPQAQGGQPGQATPPGHPGPQEDPMQEMEDLFSQLLQRRLGPGVKTQPGNPNEAFFIQVEVDKTKAYAGEQITAGWYLYTRGQVRDIDTLKYPSLSGFWKEEIELATRLNFQQEIINGIPWQKALLASFALFPIKKGTAIIDSYKAKCTVITQDNFGFGRPYQFTKSSLPVKIEVAEVPAEGRPADYSGAVGKFNMTAQFEQNSIPVNQPVILKIRFEGRGNAKLIDLPPLNLPPNVEVYDTKSDSKFFREGNSYKQFDVLLIPRDAGQIKIPPVTVSMFDPTTGKYYSQSSPELTLNVTPGSGQSQLASSPLAEIERKARAMEPVLPPLALEWEASSKIGRAERVAAWSLLFLSIFAFLGWRSYVELNYGKRGRDLNEILRRRMKVISEKIDVGDYRQVGAQTANMVYFILGDLSGEGGASVELDKLLLKAPPSLRREVGDEIVKAMRGFEALSFAPESLVGSLKEKEQMRKMVQEIEKLLIKAIRVSGRSKEPETLSAQST